MVVIFFVVSSMVVVLEGCVLLRMVVFVAAVSQVVVTKGKRFVEVVVVLTGGVTGSIGAQAIVVEKIKAIKTTAKAGDKILFIVITTFICFRTVYTILVCLSIYRFGF